MQSECCNGWANAQHFQQGNFKNPAPIILFLGLSLQPRELPKDDLTTDIKYTLNNAESYKRYVELLDIYLESKSQKSYIKVFTYAESFSIVSALPL